MILAVDPHYRLPETIPTAVVFIVAAAAVAIWLAAHLFKRWPDWPLKRVWLLAVRTAIGIGALLAVAQLMQRGLVFATNWPIWPLAVVGALAVELSVALYALERKIVSVRAGVALVVMRLGIVLIVVAMLAQPVRQWEQDVTLERFVAVLVDNSASMHIADAGMTPGEKVRLAEKLGVAGVRRPWRLESVPRTLAKARQELEAQVDWLGSLSTTDMEARKKQYEGRRTALRDALKAVQKTVAGEVKTLDEPTTGSLPLKDQLRTGLRDASKKLDNDVAKVLASAVDTTSAGGLLPKEQMDRMLGDLRRAGAVLVDLEAKAALFGDGLDEACYASLAAPARQGVDDVARRTRFDLAKGLLLRRAKNEGDKAKAEGGLLTQLQKNYGVRLYTFASKPAEVGLKEWQEAYDPSAPAKPEGELAALPEDQQHTDMAAAVEKVASDIPSGQLAGVVLVTDGRQNGPGRIEAFAHKFGLEGVPMSSIAMGGAKPPIDAAIVSVEAPETIFPQDKMYANVTLKLDGLAGKDAKVALMDGAKEIGSQTVHITQDSMRTRVQLADEPADKGLHAYRVVLQKFPGEVLSTNNDYPLTVNVSDDQVRTLLVDRRPRWEFRYLKNLFADRDRTVKLQYVLLEPDKILDAPPREKIPATVTAKPGEIEATMLPENEAEWLKFDTIILGDLGPSHLSEEQQKILRKFVVDRGGTLIVVAGEEYMPRAFADTPLAELLPVRFQGSAESADRMPEKAFKFALTPEGRESVVTRLAVDPKENEDLWDQQPDIYWRYPIVDTKPGAVALLYALPPSPPPALRLPSADDKAAAVAAATAGKPSEDAVGEDVQKLRRQFERSHALVTMHQAALGQVMFLATDHTWRLRYRTGDTYHHKFWGQVLRWATTGKLPQGTEYVRLGTDRWRYGAGEPIRVRAKIVRPDYSAVTSGDVAVNVYAGDKIVLHKKMAYVPNSAGLYQADLGALGGGTYRVELDAPAAKAILAPDKVETVVTQFSVDVATPVEQVELSPDRGLLGRLAELTGGTMVSPSRADDVKDSLGPGTQVYPERREFVLWDSWPLLILALALATAEWVTRKKVGLA